MYMYITKGCLRDCQCVSLMTSFTPYRRVNGNEDSVDVQSDGSSFNSMVMLIDIEKQAKKVINMHQICIV